MDIFNILALVGGLAMFLFGMNIMSSSLEDLSGSKLERVLEKLTSNTLKGVAIGAMVTAVIQSSSATTVMVVGFVNSGIMKLRQAIGIIMGANIGTTITAWILSLTGLEGDNFFIKLLKPTSFTPILAIIGIIMIMSGKSKKRTEIGMMFLGFTVLMFGMDTMSNAVKPLAEVPGFTNVLLMFSNPIMGILAGAVLTAIIQSSSASVGILQALSATGVITFGAAVPIIMGQNIGTCATAILSSIGANKNARRAALVHLYFNVIGVLLFLVLYYTVTSIVSFDFLSGTLGAAEIALVHTVFNLFSTIILLPFTKLLERLAYATIAPDKSESKENEFAQLDERFLNLPAFAIEQCRALTVKMAKLACDNLLLSISLLKKYSKKDYEQVVLNEERIDIYEDKLGTYLIQVGSKNLVPRDSQRISLLLHCIGDFERISDHALNIAESFREINKKELELSDKALEEIEVFTKAIKEIIKTSVEAFTTGDLDKARSIEPLEEVIDHLQIELKKRHIKRLRKGKCTIETGFIFSDLLTNFERVADHCSNIAVCLIQISENNFEMHEYISELLHAENPYFIDKYTVFSKKYQLPKG